MDNHLIQIASRLRGLRDALDLEVEDVASRCGIEAATLMEIGRAHV